MQKQVPRKSSNLEEAIALLIQNQTMFVAQLAESSRENEKRFTEIMRQLQELDQIKAILLRHERLLSELPEAILQKIGFQPS